MITQERLKEILEYDLLTGLFTYKVSRGNKKAGSTAGSLHKTNGYIEITIDGKSYYAHRLVFLFMLGKMPDDQVDHINHIKEDNKWLNLREVTASENHHNRAKNSNNTSGTAGVGWNKASNKWYAAIYVEGKQKHLGYFTDLEEAIAERKQAEIDYSFHPNHGKQY